MDICLSPRDLTKLKENLVKYGQELVKNPKLFPTEIFEKLMAAIHEKQVDGMGTLYLASFTSMLSETLNSQFPFF